MKYLLSILISLTFLVSCTQNEEQKTTSKKINDWKKHNLSGEVKSYRETKFLAVNDFSIIEKGEKKKHLFNRETLFNFDGFKIETNDYTSDGTLANRTTYLYQNSTLKEYNCYDSQGTPFKTGKYEYNDIGQVAKLIDNTTDGKHNWTKKFQYDNNGNVIEIEQYKNENIIDTKEKYIYDDDGNMIESDFYKLDKLITKTNHKYDEDGNLTELNYGKSSTFTYKYSYDFKGNWIKKIVYENNNPRGIISREIEYFE